MRLGNRPERMIKVLEWMICSVCGAKRNPKIILADGPESIKPKSVYGDHEYKSVRCSGSDLPPSETYLGDTCGVRRECLIRHKDKE